MKVVASLAGVDVGLVPLAVALALVGVAVVGELPLSTLIGLLRAAVNAAGLVPALYDLEARVAENLRQAELLERLHPEDLASYRPALLAWAAQGRELARATAGAFERELAALEQTLADLDALGDRLGERPTDAAPPPEGCEADAPRRPTLPAPPPVPSLARRLASVLEPGDEGVEPAPDSGERPSVIVHGGRLIKLSDLRGCTFRGAVDP